MHPQPADLPDPWEEMLAVPDPGKSKDYSSLGARGAIKLYLNTADNAVQHADPRPPPEDPDGRLPAGWEKRFDQGDAYFYNVNTDVFIYGRCAPLIHLVAIRLI